MVYALKNKFVIPKPVIEIFVSLPRTCLKKRPQPHKGLVVQPIVSKDLNLRGKVDLMDFQSTPDCWYKWLMNFQDNSGVCAGGG